MEEGWFKVKMLVFVVYMAFSVNSVSYKQQLEETYFTTGMYGTEAESNTQISYSLITHYFWGACDVTAAVLINQHGGQVYCGCTPNKSSS